jgi:hypothetical protein
MAYKNDISGIVVGPTVFAWLESTRANVDPTTSYLRELHGSRT